MISIIIVGYNGRSYIDDCLSSINASSYKHLRIIFVDNASVDYSATHIKRKFPKVILLESRRNLGFAGGNNLGIKKAIDLGTDYVFLLNQDTIIDKECLNSLIKKADQNTILQPLILLYENGKQTKLINTTGNYLNFLGIGFCRDYRKNMDDAIEEEIPTASGAAVLIPLKALKEVGTFDELFFMYYEDVDLFWRMRLHGYSIKLIPEAKVWHKYSFGSNKNKLYFAERNRLLFMLKNFSSKYLLVISPAFVVNELCTIAYAAISGWGIKKIMSYYSIISIRREIFDYRKINSEIISETAPSLKKYIGPDVTFSEVNSIFLRPYARLVKTYYQIIYDLL